MYVFLAHNENDLFQYQTTEVMTATGIYNDIVISMFKRKRC